MNLQKIVFCVSGNGNHIPFIIDTIDSIKKLNPSYNICLGTYFQDEKMQVFAIQNNYRLFKSQQNVDLFTNNKMKYVHHKNVHFPELILQMSLCKNVYDGTDYEYVIFVHPDMYFGYDFVSQIITLSDIKNIYTTKLLTTFPYNNIKLVENITTQSLLNINSDMSLIMGYRLNQPISLWKKSFLNMIFMEYGSWENVYKLLLYEESLCTDVAMFNFNRKIYKKYRLMCNFINVNNIVQGIKIENKISHLTFFATKVGV